MKTMETKRKDPITLATDLAAYGICGAGGDETKEQQIWGANCIDAAVLILKAYGGEYISLYEGHRMYLKALEAKADEMRKEAENLPDEVE